MRSPDHARTDKLRGPQGALEVGNLRFYQYSLSSVVDLRRDKRDLALGNVFTRAIDYLNRQIALELRDARSMGT